MSPACSPGGRQGLWRVQHDGTQGGQQLGRVVGVGLLVGRVAALGQRNEGAGKGRKIARLSRQLGILRDK